jgi:hypothetical protein
MRWSAPFQINVASVSAPDRNTVVFVEEAEFAFHALFTLGRGLDDAQARLEVADP